MWTLPANPLARQYIIITSHHFHNSIDEIIWSVREEPIAQDPDGLRPALGFDTGSVQAGKSDQLAFNQPGTVSMTFVDRSSSFYIYDGVNSHVGVSLFSVE